ncbi:hypothetical protein AABM34_13055 [Lysinibacillus fusiformis]
MENLSRYEVIIIKKVESDITKLFNDLKKNGVELIPIFDVHEKDNPDLSVYYRVMGKKEKMNNLISKLKDNILIEAAYLKPPTELPKITNTTFTNETPDYSLRQGYINPPPEGINAKYAWTISGGKGAGIKIIDIEGGWNNNHEDLIQNNGGVVAGQASTELDWVNHGTAVIGVLSGDENTYGIKGICPDSYVMEVSHINLGSASAIYEAARRLNLGDIIILEMHRPKFHYDFETRTDQKGYIAIEWW